MIVSLAPITQQLVVWAVPPCQEANAPAACGSHPWIRIRWIHRWLLLDSSPQSSRHDLCWGSQLQFVSCKSQSLMIYIGLIIDQLFFSKQQIRVSEVSKAMTVTPAQLELVIRRLCTLGCPTETWALIILRRQSPSLVVTSSTSTISKDFIYLVLFVYWFDFGDLYQDSFGLQVIEMFAGVARVARTARRRGLRARAYEINFDSERKKRFRFNTHNRGKKTGLHGYQWRSWICVPRRPCLVEC